MLLVREELLLRSSCFIFKEGVSIVSPVSPELLSELHDLLYVRVWINVVQDPGVLVLHLMDKWFVWSSS